MEKKVKIGQIIYRDTSSGVSEHTVEKIGTKYFEATGLNRGIKIGVYNLLYISDHSSNHNIQFYLNKEDIIEKKETKFLFDAMRSSFGGYTNNGKLTIATLKEIAKILAIEIPKF